MARVLRPFQRPLYRYSNALSSPAAAGNRIAEDRAVIELWDLLEPLWVAVDALKPRGQTGRPTRPMEIRRSLMLKMAIGIRALGLGPQVGLRRIQTSFALRESLGIAIPDGASIDCLRRARGGEDVAEAGFPTRQNLSDFVKRWLSANGGFDVLDEFAHLLLPYMIGVELCADYTGVAIDSKMAPSPRRFTEIEDMMGIGRERGPILAGTAGRLAHGVIACKDVPVLLAGDLINLSELAWAVHYGIPNVARNAQIMEKWLLRDGIPKSSFLTAHGATWVGDGLYAKNDVAIALMEHDAQHAFRITAFPWREVIVDQYVAHPEGHPDVTVKLDIASGGVCYCPCDRQLGDRVTSLLERIPMAQFAGKPGLSGFNFYACERAACSRRGVKLKVHFSAVRNTDGHPNYTVVTQMPRADKRSDALNFKGQQTIEQRNNAMADLGVARKTPDQSFVLTGAANCRFELLLTHIVLNSRILLNVRAGRLERTEYSWLTAFENSIKKGRQIVTRTRPVDENGVPKEYPTTMGAMFYPRPEEREKRRIAVGDGVTEVTRLRPKLEDNTSEIAAQQLDDALAATG
jgi:hypothetical protein